jgi:hypothetical protein
MKCLMGGAALRIKVRVGPSYISIEHARRVLVTEQDGPPLSPAHDHIDLPTVALSKDFAEGIESLSPRYECLSEFFTGIIGSSPAPAW